MLKQTDKAVLFLAGAIILVGVSITAFLYGKSSTSPLTSQEASSDTQSHFPTSDETAGWKTYINNKCQYEIKYPPTWQLSAEPEDAVVGAAVLYPYEIGSGITPPSDWFKVQIGCATKNSSQAPQQIVASLNSRNDGSGVPEITNLHQTTVNDLLAFEQIIHPKVGPTVLDYIVFPNNTKYIDIAFTPSETTAVTTIDQILSTFKFNEQTGSINPIKAMTIPSDWKKFTATDQEFKVSTTMSLPSGLSFRFTGSEFTIQNDSDATEIWEYFTSVLDSTTNYYKGESRRVWYQNYLQGKVVKFSDVHEFKTKGTITAASEHSIGSTSYLEVTVQPNYGKSEKHYLYVQNGILNIIKPSSEKANSDQAVLPQNMGTILYSLSVKRTN